ncbi:MAG: flagellar biosynthetic protein FliO [Planctomycetota bacterium]
MVGFKKKIVAFLVTIALGSGVLVLCSAQSATDRTKSGPDNAGFRSVPPVLSCEGKNGGPKSKAGSLFANDPNFSERQSDSAGSRELFYKMVLSVLLVVVLGVAAIYVSKKLLPKITNLPGKEIRIVETAHLGPRQAVHLLEIGDRRFLIGSTNENITKLADITGTLTDLTAQEINDN